MKKYFIIIAFLIPLASWSQVITGFVSANDKEGKHPLPGVNVFWEGTQSGTATDHDGSFALKWNNKTTNLVFSFVGYSSKVIKVTAPGQLQVVLEPDLEIGEVVVVEKDRGTYMSSIDPISSHRIGGAELHKAACCNLAESFETNPSVDVSYSDALTGAKQIKLLGLDGVYSLLQFENIPGLRGLATNFGINYVPGPWMESIQVSKGAASVVNGFESVAGQINVEYKKPDSAEKLLLNLFTSDEGKIEINANTNIRLKKDNITTGILIHAENFANRIDHNLDGFLDHPLTKQVHLSNRWKYNDHKGWMAQAGANLLFEDRLGGEVDFEKSMNHAVSAQYGISILTSRFEGYFKSGYVWPDQHTALALLSNFSAHQNNAFYGRAVYKANEIRYYANLILTRDLNDQGTHVLNSGLSFISDAFREELYGIKSDRTELIPGIMGEYTFKPNENLTLMAGIRADLHNIHGAFMTPRMHFRYKFLNNMTLRMNVGKGYRSAGVIAENATLLSGYRPLKRSADAILENAWNYGIGLVQDYKLFGRNIQINLEYFRTDFINQVVIDRESSAEYIVISPLDGKSYANSIQADVTIQPAERLDIKLAYRINDVWQTIGGKLLEAPLASRYKGLITANYYTNLKKWMFDYTVQFNGGGRIPLYPASGNRLADMLQAVDKFSPYTLMNAQVTRYFRSGSIYAGSENITNFRQMHPVAGYENPFGPGFDATNVWGPVMGRRIYLGLRFNLNYN